VPSKGSSVHLRARWATGQWPHRPHRRLEEESVRLAAVAAIRHRHTNYDELLMESADRVWARAEVREQIDKILSAWGPPEPEGT
jgi:hypothetical protein